MNTSVASPTSCCTAQVLHHSLAFPRRYCLLVSQGLCRQWRRPAIMADHLPIPKGTFFGWRLRQNGCYSSHATADGGYSKQKLTLQQYRDAFARRMDMAGLNPHHRIAIGVSGGADSMALCLLTSAWKSAGRPNKASGYIDGLLAIIVDHDLRAESAAEANHVRDLVSRMGVECEVARCNWTIGKPKQGHLQEKARNMRYHIFENICLQRQINVLLIAQHSDDQAELFVLRLSRNSGVLGLAGMAFMSQLFPTCCGNSLNCGGILLVRPLLEFSKTDLYEICQASEQEWVEDPSNKSSFFARNRIRSSLGNFISNSFGRELQATISACRTTRSYVDQVCYKLIHQSVVIMDHGYIVIDLLTLDPSNVEDLCLSKFTTLILQFISQRHRPVRGGTLQLLLNYIRTFPCKNSLTAAGCYLCAVPRSKGTNLAVCWSPDCPQQSKPMLSCAYNCQHHLSFQPNEVGDIIKTSKFNLDYVDLNRSDVPFLSANSASILDEARKLGLLSESSVRSIALIQQKESEFFCLQEESKTSPEIKHERNYVGALLGEPLHAGELKYFMNRFLVSWKFYETVAKDVTLSDMNSKLDTPEYLNCQCISCAVRDGQAVILRCMKDTDWMYLSELGRTHSLKESQGQTISSLHSFMCNKNTISCSGHLLQSATRALQALQSIPVAARRGLPVLVDSQGLLLSIPSIGFNCCPNISVFAVFQPRVPLGGGFTSYA